LITLRAPYDIEQIPDEVEHLLAFLGLSSLGLLRLLALVFGVARLAWAAPLADLTGHCAAVFERATHFMRRLDRARLE
jgi:hypothetical protein